ncbi:MAG: 4a-hydroxytetrahydrobiopterin dehydratase [Anaerolineales bacterium]|jgi:4a-hydroxytetrahydrobiopterin dehydratase
MTALAERELKPPRGEGSEPLKGQSLQELIDELNNSWKVIDGQRLEKKYKFDNFQQALDFTNKVGALAEEVNHHPEICLTWGEASITIWTHSIGGLSEADFVFAARSDRFAAG